MAISRRTISSISVQAKARGNEYRQAITGARNQACAPGTRPQLPLSGLQPQALRRCPPHRALVGRRRNEPRQPGKYFRLPYGIHGAVDRSRCTGTQTTAHSSHSKAEQGFTDHCHAVSKAEGSSLRRRPYPLVSRTFWKGIALTKVTCWRICDTSGKPMPTLARSILTAYGRAV